jgi:hypothetical protein
MKDNRTCDKMFARQITEVVASYFFCCRPNPFICGIRMRSTEFQLEPSTSTPFGRACADYLQAPGCGFLCGSINFSCEFINLSTAVTKLQW